MPTRPIRKPASRPLSGYLIASLLALLSGAAVAGSQLASDSSVETLLASEQPPQGVVFEIASGDPRSLDWAIPRIQRYVKSLRDRFPDLEIAVVTHGREQFALTSDQQTSQGAVHDNVQSLVRDQNVPVHVCETYAEMNDVAAEQFPDYVQVAPAGPAQVRAYEDLGYSVIRLRRH